MHPLEFGCVLYFCFHNNNTTGGFSQTFSTFGSKTGAYSGGRL